MWHILRAVLLSSIRIIWGYFSWMISYSRKNCKKKIEKRYKKARKLILKVNHNLRLDVLVEGKENIPEETCCFYSNHMGAADTSHGPYCEDGGRQVRLRPDGHSAMPRFQKTGRRALRFW